MNLNQITLDSNDVPRAVAFYQALGLRMIVDSAPRYVRMVCQDDGTSLSIHHAEEMVKPDGTTLYFESDQLDQQVAALRAKGIVFTSDPVDRTWLWREASLLDPDGRRVILYHAGKNRLDPPWRIQ